MAYIPRNYGMKLEKYMAYKTNKMPIGFFIWIIERPLFRSG